MRARERESESVITPLPIIQGVWIGKALSLVEQLSIKSFLKNGHIFHLYCYQEVQDIPPGTVIKDANEIIPEKQIFRFHGSYAAFSDLFRYRLLYLKGNFYVDLDIICLRPFDLQDPIVFGLEIHEIAPQLVYLPTTCVLKFPPQNPVLAYMVRRNDNAMLIILAGRLLLWRIWSRLRSQEGLNAMRIIRIGGHIWKELRTWASPSTESTAALLQAENYFFIPKLVIEVLPSFVRLIFLLLCPFGRYAVLRKKILAQLEVIFLWGEISGPVALTETLRKHNLTRLAKPHRYFCPITSKNCEAIFRQEDTLELEKTLEHSYAVHLYNWMLTINKTDKNNIPPNSLFAKLQRRYNVES